LAAGVNDPAVPHLDCSLLDRPPGTCKIDQQLSRCGRALPYCRNRPRRGATARRHPIVRHHARIGQDQLHVVDRHAEFLSRRLRQLGSRALSTFDLAGQHRDASLGAKVNARRKISRAAAEEGIAAALPILLSLRQRGQRNRDEESRAQRLYEGTAAQAEIVSHAVERLAFAVEWWYVMWRRSFHTRAFSARGALTSRRMTLTYLE